MDDALITAIVLARLGTPLLIPRFPLPMILVALVLDAADNSLLAAFTDVDLGPEGPYQSFDKALDVYYLSIAYLATMRNWTSEAAFRVGQFLFFYRLVGVALFELLESRTLLLIFPNTFEYFFILYEAVRLRFDPARLSARFWLLAAAIIWVVVKLPQEYWIHVAQRDFTDTVTDNSAVGAVCALVVLALIGFFLFWVRPRLPEPAWGWRLVADPLPAAGRSDRLVWSELAEKTVLLGLLAVIFTQILPGVDATPAQVAAGVAAIVVANDAIGIWSTRRGRAGIESFVLRCGVLLAVNLGLVWAAWLILADNGNFQLGTGLFLAFLVALIVGLYDLYRPVHRARFAS